MFEIKYIYNPVDLLFNRFHIPNLLANKWWQKCLFWCCRWCACLPATTAGYIPDKTHAGSSPERPRLVCQRDANRWSTYLILSPLHPCRGCDAVNAPTFKSLWNRGVDNKNTHTTHKQPLSIYIHLDGHFRKLSHFMPTFLVLFVVRPVVIYMCKVTFRLTLTSLTDSTIAAMTLSPLASAQRFTLYNPLPVIFRVKE